MFVRMVLASRKDLASGLIGLTLALVGCAMAADDQATVDIDGAIYVDFHTDSPCSIDAAPAELTGVKLTFRGTDRTLLGGATTGEPAFQPLEFGEGKTGWTYPGCRYYASYSAIVTRAESYQVSFESTSPDMLGAGAWFTGVSDLEPQSISHDELEAQGFGWDFEASPSYVVGH